MNIYIKPELEEKLRKEPSMSGLINDLLKKHYDPIGYKIDHMSNFEQLSRTTIDDKGNLTLNLDDPTYTDPEATA